jgi:signal transduction histidine kinase
MDVRMIAHDMRTPLNALILSLEAADSSACDEATRRTCLCMAKKNAKALSEMIESILATRELVDGGNSLLQRKCRAQDLVASALDQVAALAEKKSQSLVSADMSGLPDFYADGEKLIHVLVNLLNNAVKFTHAGGTIIVDANVRQNDGHTSIVFTVADNGIGVSAEDVDRIFLKGVSIASAGKYSCGLGLSVCRELVEAHHGRIWVEPDRTQGSAFSFFIPLKQVP